MGWNEYSGQPLVVHSQVVRLIAVRELATSISYHTRLITPCINFGGTGIGPIWAYVYVCHSVLCQLFMGTTGKQPSPNNFSGAPFSQKDCGLQDARSASMLGHFLFLVWSIPFCSIFHPIQCIINGWISIQACPGLWFTTDNSLILDFRTGRWPFGKPSHNPYYKLKK